jgi:hypothetical protein
MKTIKYIIPIFLLTALIAACAKKKSDGVSKEIKVTYPSIVLKGQEFVSLNIGDTYTDEGAIKTDDVSGAKTDIMHDATDLDNQAPGLYFMTYSATNANGFTTTVNRVIAVSNMDDSKDNLAGNYERTSNGAPVVVTKLKRALYKIDNVGGVLDPSSPAVLPVYMVRLNDTTISVPEQMVPNEYGLLDCSGETLRITPDTAFSYKVVNPGFGTATRTFVKVP